MSYVGGSCDSCVTPVPIGLGFGTALFLGLGLRGPDLGLGLDNFKLQPLQLVAVASYPHQLVASYPHLLVASYLHQLVASNPDLVAVNMATLIHY